MPADSELGAFPVRHVAQVEERPEEEAWLVEFLWGRRAVGFVAAPPKMCKTFLGCELAVAVATGAPALGRFAVPRPGPVVFYGAEDDQPSLRARFEPTFQGSKLTLVNYQSRATLSSFVSSGARARAGHGSRASASRLRRA